MTRNKKIIAFSFIVLFLFEIWMPTIAFGLTDGPGQPEYSSFQPIGMDNMVDLFSGDFNYNIPLMNIPGPDGGYPINIHYNSSVGMEDEASWVGLGWNLNVGSVARTMSGLPDDFNGLPVLKKNNMKTNFNLALDIEKESEIFSVEFKDCAEAITDGGKGQIYYDNILGPGINYSKSMSFEKSSLSLGLTADSKGGISIAPSYNAGLFKNKRSFNLGASINSKAGVQNFNFSTSKIVKDSYQNLGVKRGGYSATTAMSYVPSTKVGTTTVNGRFGLRLAVIEPNEGTLEDVGALMLQLAGDIEPPFTAKKTVFAGEASRTFIKAQYRKRVYKGFGYSFSENTRLHQGDNVGDNDIKNELLDFNLENEGLNPRTTPNAPNVMPASDSYSVSGHGFSGLYTAFRNDHGYYYSPEVKSENYGGALTLDFKAKEKLSDLGGEAGITYSDGYSGPISNEKFGPNGSIKFTGTSGSKEGHFYKQVGGHNTIQDPSDSKRDDDPYRFKTPGFLGGSVNPRVQNEMVNDDYGNQSSLTDFTDKTREQANSVLKSYTCAELTADQLISSANNFNYSKSFDSEYSDSDVEGAFDDYTTDDLVGAFVGTGGNGMRYEYGIPVYNNYQKEAIFSTDVNDNESKIIDYGTEENSLDNSAGIDHFYQSTELPPYAYAHLLTGIFSTDYVDINGDGPTEDDLGYYVKFNYTKQHDDYKWRAPFIGANNMPGNLSDELDNKASVLFGSKEVYYVESIETKTHKAVFEISEREDGSEAKRENQFSNDSDILGDDNLFRLDKVYLYSKLDESNPIQTVNFVYDYSLCQGTLNNSSGEGKLTLKSIYTSNYGNEKGKVNPYEFIYSGENLDLGGINPSYNPEQIDHWGTYKPEGNTLDNYYGHNMTNPYTNQSNDGLVNRNDNVSAWLLKEIILPSGGKQTVEYESDTYSYVQNKNAQQFFKIVGLSKSSSASTLTTTQIQNGTEDEMKAVNSEQHHWVHVEIPEYLENQNVASYYVDQMLSGIDDIYFKCYMDLKFPVLGSYEKSKDYVNGYAVYDSEAFQPPPYQVGSKWYCAIPIKNHYDVKHHPFRVEGINKLRYERPDLFRNNQGEEYAIHVIVEQTLALIPEILSLVAGFINGGIAKGWCKNADLDSEKFPSFIRLNDGDGIKYGGGHRVKSISIDDQWKNFDPDENGSVYTLNYNYSLEDGTSSGVACFEPRIGGEENAIKSVKRYYGNYLGDALSIGGKHKWLEHPINANYYQSAKVGYSRVITTSSGGVQTQDDFYTSADLNQDERLQGAQIVNEFYTCKNFPVKVNQTDYEIVRQIPPIIPIPCVGTMTRNNSMISQGYSVELNDMHGKAKAVKTFHSTADIDNSETIPYAKTEYVYKTINGNDLDSEVRFYHPKNGSLVAATGRSVEMATYMNVNRNIGAQVSFDADIQLETPLVMPSAWPPTNYFETHTRTVTTNKIIRKQGILDKVITKVGDSFVEAKNVAFDKKTGAPIIVQKTTNYDDPIYACSIPAHWNYKDFGDTKSSIGFSQLYENTQVNLMVDGIVLLGEETYWNCPIEKGDKLKISVLFADNSPSCFDSEVVYVNEVIRDEDNPEISLKLKDIQGFDVVDFSIFNGDCFESLSEPLADDWELRIEILETNRNNILGVNSGSILTLDNPIQNGLLGSNWLTDLNGAIQSFGNYAEGGSPNLRFDTSSLCGDKYNALGDFWIEGNILKIEISFVNLSNLEVFDLNLEFACTDRFELQYDEGLDQDVLVLVVTPEHDYSNTYIEISPDGSEFTIVDNLDEANDEQFFGSDINLNDPQLALDFFGDDCEGEVLQVSATTFSDDWEYYYTDSDLTSEQAISNPYRYGRKGNYRLEDNYAYQTHRTQTEGIDLSTDGTFSYTPFTWSQIPEVDEDALNIEWTKAGTMTLYDAFNNALESTNPLDIRSAALFNRDGNYLIASCVNAFHHEIAFEDFEDFANGLYTSGNRFNLIGSSSITSEASHSGSNSLVLGNGSQLEFSYSNVDPIEKYFYPRYEPENISKRYLFSFWVKSDDFEGLAVNYSGNSDHELITDGIVIEGWQKVEVIFSNINFSSFGTISITNQSGENILLDDFRVHPYESVFTSNVFDYENTRLVASLNNQNYSTFYNYDQEGSLVQTKQETTRGIVTLQTGRSNIKK